ncbi:MAG TPA: hypothetical protein VF221_11005 [Chloroflexota bacterium]
MDTALTQQTMTEPVMMNLAVARQTISALMRYAGHTKQTIEGIADADSAVGACALTLSFVSNVRNFVESIEATDLCNRDILRNGEAFLRHADTQAVTAMATEHELSAIKGHLYMAVAIADRLLRSVQSDIVIKT